MSVVIITNLSEAVEHIKDLQKEIDTLQNTVIWIRNEIINDPNFRLYGKSLSEIRILIDKGLTF